MAATTFTVGGGPAAAGAANLGPPPNAVSEGDTSDDASESSFGGEDRDDTETRAVEQALVNNMQIASGAASQASQVCDSGTPDVTFDVVAINVRITLNRHGDHDNNGRMYVLRHRLDDVRAEEAGEAGPFNPNPGDVSPGLGEDAIQPLVVRANLGDCVQIDFENQLEGESASMHFHRASIEPSQEGSNVGNNGSGTVAPGQSTTYTFQIENRDELEGTFYFHSHGNTRNQTSHGLFGALIAEPAGSAVVHPETGETLDKATDSGWQRIIRDDSGLDFREYSIMYHEVGAEQTQISDAQGDPMPQFETVTNTYRPGSRALNYRSEPFLRRMQLEDVKPLAYGSYTFGDPPTPMPQSYVGDPSKTRLLHAGAETFHSHHLHGGAIRWPFQPQTEDSRFGNGLDKEPSVSLSDSERLDVQNIGPGEAYTLEHECGSGGCQQGAGEFLYHCHFINHYPAGMWGFWRVFDTQQDNLAQLPDRAGQTPEPVTSDALVDLELPSGEVLTTGATGPGQLNIDEWIEGQLPPRGVPSDKDDATVWNWQRDEASGGSPLYRGEPEGPAFVNFEPLPPDDPSLDDEGRPELLFNPDNGRVAFPMLRPHEGQRPPWAPNRDGAPYLRTRLEPNDHPTNSSNTTVPADTRAGPDAICPAGVPIERINLVAIDLPIPRNGSPDSESPGELWVLAEDVHLFADVRDGGASLLDPGQEAALAKAHQAVLRANVGDCVEFTIVNNLRFNQTDFDKAERTNLHGHFMQFDTQASDGVISGLSFEQSMWNYELDGRVLTQAVSAGDTVLPVTNVDGLHAGEDIGGNGIGIAVGAGTEGIEVHEIAEVDASANTITLAEPLVRDHDPDQAVTTEFNRQTWYMDSEVGTIYFHDHVDGNRTWPRGLFGAIIIQPEGSQHLDPQTGDPVRNAPVVDIVPPSGGAYRDFALLLTENDPSTGTSVNLRNEPLDRGQPDGAFDPAYAFSSVMHGDPATTLLRAYEDDPVRIRLLHGGPGHTGAHSFRLSGHQFSTERHDGARLFDSLTIANAERFDPMVDGGAGDAGDYLWYNAQAKHLEEGYWGIFRVHDTLQTGENGLRPLPGNTPSQGDGFPHLSETGEAPPAATPPSGDPDVVVNAEAIPVDIGYAGLPASENLKAIFVTEEDKDAVLSGQKDPEPLVIRAAAGDLVEVNLTNSLGGALEADRVSMHAGRVQFDPQSSQGITVGFNPDQTVGDGESITYQFRAPAGNQVLGAGLLADFGQVPTDFDRVPPNGDGTPCRNNCAADNLPGGTTTGVAAGLYGAIVIAPAGSSHEDPRTGQPTDTGWEVVVREGNGDAYRDFALLFHESDDFFGNAQPVMPYRLDVRGFTGINYGNARSAFSQTAQGDVFGPNPDTPILEAFAGDPTQVHAVYAYGHSAGTFAVNGHRWAYDPNVEGSELLATRTWTPGVTVDAELDGGAGGVPQAPGDYLYLNHRLPFMEAGQWGLLRAHADGADTDIRPLDAGPAGVVGSLDGVPVT